MSYHILIADDAMMNRTLVKDILERNLKNITFSEAINGLEVLEIVEKEPIDLIILDLIMPKMDGYETLKLLKAHPIYHDIPVIVNSSITEIKSIERTLEEGAVDYFTKPLSPNDMQIILPLKAKNALLLHEQQKTIIALNHQISQELKNANAFANIMLPKATQFNTIELFIKYHPSLGIGGDFFDCVEKDNKIYFMMADVTGHGIAAGMASSMVKIMYRRIIEHDGIMPHEVLKEMNDMIFKTFDFAGKDHYFVFTAFVGMIDNDKLYYANAAHPYPMLYRANTKSFTEIRQNGFLVGMLDFVTYETESTDFSDEDVLFLYTDGLFSAGSDSDFTGWEDVFKLSKRFTFEMEENPDEFLEELFYAFHVIHKSRDTDFTDDVAMMLIKKRSND